MEELDDWKKSINKRISSGLDKTLFISLKEYIFDADLKNTIISLESRFNDLQRENARGVLNHEQKEVKKNNLINSLLEITNSLTNKDRKPPLINNQSKSRIIKDEDLAKMLRIYQRKKELESIKASFIYKKEFLKFRNELQSKLDKYFKKGLLNYNRERVYWHDDKNIPLSKRMFLGYKYNIEDVILSLNFCPFFFSIDIETIKDREKYKFKTPNYLKLTISDSEELIWTENIPTIKSQEEIKYSAKEIIDVIISDIVKWLCYEKYRKTPIKLNDSFSSKDLELFAFSPKNSNNKSKLKRN
jgi:hypothetical protein